MLKLDASTMKDCYRPGVYVFYKSGAEVLYVGATFFGIDRALDRDHRVFKKEQAFSLLWFPCDTTDTATLLEELLISHYNPKYNVVRTNWLSKPANWDKRHYLEELAIVVAKELS